MQIINIKIHNFRSIADCDFSISNYSLLIGANNAGKSNVMDALRIFYEKDIKYQKQNDFPKFETKDQDCWIEIEYKLTEDEYNNLKEDWRQPDNKLRVRKFLDTKEKGKDGKPKLGIFAYDEKSKLSDEPFYGAKNVQQGKLGEIIFIPAASKLDEHTKLSGPSALRELLNDILKKLVKTSASFKQLTTEFESFSSNIKNEKTEEKKSLMGLENDISSELQEWGAGFELNINPVTETDIVKNLVSYKILDKNLNERMDASQFGQGFQRHLIFTLIRTAANYQPPTAQGKKKEFKPDLTALIFEEPEAFLHPMQQIILCRSLKLIAANEGNQIFISSHSPNFVSHNSGDLPSIVSIHKQEKITETGQIGTNKLNTIFSENQLINDTLKGTQYEADIDDLKEEMETIKYFLWLNAERCGMFFSSLVLLVEGPTERMIIDYFFDIGKLDMPKGGVFVLDCLGKFNIHRFMNILGPLKINHAVLFDADNEKPPHEKIIKLIKGSSNDYTKKIDVFPEDIEKFLEIEKSKKAHRKPQHLMIKINEGKIEDKNIELLLEKLRTLIN